MPVQEGERLEVGTGLSAAEERVGKAHSEVSAFRDQIVATRATTLAGLKFKARYAADSAAFLSGTILALVGLEIRYPRFSDLHNSGNSFVGSLLLGVQLMLEQAQERALANRLRAAALFGQLPEDAERAREIVALFTAFAAEAGLLPRPSLAIVSPRADRRDSVRVLKNPHST
jgi:hypothetical protein